MTILSLFDGVSCGRLALERAGIKVDKYYASEISKSKIKASQNYFPDNIQIGDVTKVSGYDYDVDILLGGSPCTGFSIMGKRLNFEDPRSGLIMDYFRILEELREGNPGVYFLLENVPMDKTCEIEISRRLGVLPVKINSSRVSGQSRKRIYWTNIHGTGANLFGDEIEQPEDKNIMLKDILQPETEIDEKYYLTANIEEYVKKRILDKTTFVQLNGDKSRALQERYPMNWNGSYISKSLYLISDQFINKNQNGAGFKENPDKSYTLNTVDRQSIVIDLDKYRVRKLTPIECCRLQTVPDDFFKSSGLSDNQIYSCLGDGWTIDVVAHILKGLTTESISNTL